MTRITLFEEVDISQNACIVQVSGCPAGVILCFRLSASCFLANMLLVFCPAPQILEIVAVTERFFKVIQLLLFSHLSWH